MKRLFLVVLAAAMLFSCSGVTHRFSTLGREYDIALFSDEGFYAKYGDVIEEELSYPLVFTHTEPVFEIKKREMGQFANFRKNKNIVMIDDISTEDPVTVFLRDALGDKLINGVKGISVAHEKDVWVPGQSVLFILVNGASYEKETVASSIRDAHKVLYDYIAQRIMAGVMSERMKGAFSKSVENRFGFPMYVPARYNIFKAEEKFISFVTRTPDRLIAVAELEDDGAPLSMKKMIALRNSVTDAHYKGDKVFEEYFSWAAESPEDHYFQGFEVFDVDGAEVSKLYGLWENDEAMNGGPFVTYVFKKDGKFVLIDALLFYPSGRKWPFINKLDALLRVNIERILKKTGE